MKTVIELTHDLAQLDMARQEAQALADDRATRSYRVQSVTSAVVLGNAGQADLLAAQSALDASIDALLRVANLKQAVADIERQLVEARGRERKAHCDSVAAEHAALHDRFKAQSKELLQTFKEMQTLNFSYMGLTGRELHPAFYRELNLPVISGMLSSRSGIFTGSE